MSRIRLWCPFARRVELATGERRIAMHPEERDHFIADGIRPGEDYAFYLDGEGPLPDPRAPRLPHGVQGPAHAVDHGAFRWSDEGFSPRPWPEAIVYELHVGTFSERGDFDGVVERLDHLVELGVSHVELMPVASFSGARNWGYDGVGLFAPHEGYGGPDGLKRLVDACHRRGIAVLLDVVYNHLGPEGNYTERFAPYFTDVYKTPWGKAVNLDGPGSDEVRRFLCDNARMWLADYHIDGLRIDAIHAFLDRSATHLLEQLACEVRELERELGREKLLVAESDLNDPRVVAPQARGGYGVDAQWSDDFHHALHALLTGERDGYYADFGRVAQLAQALERGFVFQGDYSSHRRRRHGRPLSRRDEPLGPRLLGYAQTHDQVGNRARGERLSALAGTQAARLAAALVLTAPFVPMIFQGEEFEASTPFLYFCDHQDPGLGEAVRQGRQDEFAAFGWKPEDVPDPQAPETFERSRLDWRERETPNGRAMLAWHRALVELRRSEPSLAAGRLDALRVRFDEDERWLVMQRGPVHVALNFDRAAHRLPLPPAARVLLASRPEASAELPVVPAESAVVTRA